MPTSIQEFYNDKNLFITGASGFLGKVLVEKLIRSCPGIKKIYILLRPKSNKSVESRLNEFIDEKIFELCREEAREKLVACKGDITEAGLGLSKEDRAKIVENVSIVFHSAASVRFDEPLKRCLNINVMATKSVVELCHEMKNLQSFVHVSTAYANCHLKRCEERVYKLKISASQLLADSISMDDETFNTISKKYFEGRPNTYTLTKAVAENYIMENCGNLPVSIARPSIIVGCNKEPIVGWLDTINGPGGVIMLGVLGIARTMKFTPNSVSDLIPVDTVCNALIAISWQTAVKSEEEKMKVYNITSGELNPITWHDFLQYGRDAAIKAPPIRTIRPPTTVRNDDVNILEHLYIKYISELFFAFFVDLFLMICGHPARLVKIVRKMHGAFDLLEWFASREWHFECGNVVELIDKLDDGDRKEFDFDIRLLDWSEFSHKFYMGIRRYMLKEPDDNIPMAQKRIKGLYLGMWAFQIVSTSILLALAYGLFRAIRILF